MKTNSIGKIENIISSKRKSERVMKYEVADLHSLFPFLIARRFSISPLWEAILLCFYNVTWFFPGGKEKRFAFRVLLFREKERGKIVRDSFQIWEQQFLKDYPRDVILSGIADIISREMMIVFFLIFRWMKCLKG